MVFYCFLVFFLVLDRAERDLVRRLLKPLHTVIASRASGR
jgi:hypothetical protein